jgi:hypothetical protein
MEPIGCPETSVRNYHYSLSNGPEERNSQLLRGGSLKSRKFLVVVGAREAKSPSTESPVWKSRENKQLHLSAFSSCFAEWLQGEVTSNIGG